MAGEELFSDLKPLSSTMMHIKQHNADKLITWIPLNLVEIILMDVKRHHYDLIGFLNEFDWSMLGSANNNRCLASAVGLSMHNK